MILAVTMNPSVDIAYQVSSFRLNHANRADETFKTPGGKGLNVARVLHSLGAQVTAAGLIGGRNGDYIEEQLNAIHIPTAFCRIEGDTRNCIAILHEGSQTEILEPGPTVSPKEYRRFRNGLKKQLRECAIAVFSGSLPSGIDEACYGGLCRICAEEAVPVILDCSGNSLKKALSAKWLPFVIKPNLDELSSLLERNVMNETGQLKAALLDPVFRDVPWVIVSLGKDGCFARHYDTFYEVKVPMVHAISPVGSGDAMVAGIADGIERSMSDEELLCHASTAGILNAMEKETGCIDMKNYASVYRQVTVRKV